MTRIALAALLLAASPAAAQAIVADDATSPLLQPFAGEIRFCWERGASLRSGLHGEVVVRATLDAGGHTTEAALVSSSVDGDEGVSGSCLLAAVRRWVFATTTGGVYELHFGLRAAAPTRLGGAPVVVTARSRLTYANDTALLVDDGVADSLLADIAAMDDAIRACIVDDEDARSGSGGLEILITVPGGGDIRRDDLTVDHGTFDASHPVSRCIRDLGARFDAPTAYTTGHYRWTLTWDVSIAHE